MKTIDKIIHVVVFICFLFYFLWLSLSTYNTVQFLKSRKVVLGKIILRDTNANKLNKIPIKILYYDSYRENEREGLVRVDPLKFRELVSKDRVDISYGKFSNEIYVTSYKEPNGGRLAISIMGLSLVVLILILYIKRFLRSRSGNTFN